MVKIEPISERSAPRKCSKCLQPARFWRYGPDKLGGTNKSSKQPRCEKHAEAQS